DLGATPLENITVMDNAVTFTANVNAQGMALALDFSGTIAGDTLAGNFDTEFGAIPVTGTRQYHQLGRSAPRSGADRFPSPVEAISQYRSQTLLALARCQSAYSSGILLVSS